MFEVIIGVVFFILGAGVFVSLRWGIVLREKVRSISYKLDSKEKIIALQSEEITRQNRKYTTLRSQYNSHRHEIKEQRMTEGPDTSIAPV